MSSTSLLSYGNIDRIITATVPEVEYLCKKEGAFFALSNLSNIYPTDVLLYARFPVKAVIGITRIDTPIIDTPTNLMVKYEEQPLDKRRFWKWKSIHKEIAYAYPVLKIHLFKKYYTAKELVLPSWPYENTHIGYLWTNLAYRPYLRKVAEKFEEDMKGIEKWEEITTK